MAQDPRLDRISRMQTDNPQADLATRVANLERRMRAAELDWASPWQALTRPAGISDDHSGVRVSGIDVRLRGAVQNTSGGSLPTSSLIATLPVGARPINTVLVLGTIYSGGAGTPVALQIGPNGAIFALAALASLAFVYLDGVTFDTTE